MKRAMIITVGVGRDVENAIAFTIMHHMPNFVGFCCSENSKDKVNKVVAQLGLKEESFTLFVKEEIIHFEKLYLYYCRCIKEIEDKGFHKSEIVADYTSGTKAMSSALVTASISK